MTTGTNKATLMDPEDEGLALLHKRLGNDFADKLRAFEDLANRWPEAAFCAAWRFLTEATTEIDDGSCCFVLETSVKVVGRERVEQKILDNWQHLGEFARLNILDGIASETGMSTDFANTLYHHPATTVRQRHRIVAGLVSGARNRRVGNIVALATQIGTYSDRELQAILDKFVADVVREYS